MSKISDRVTELVRPIIEEQGIELWDVEYVREGGSFYLRIFIDKEGGVGIDDCENISRLLDPVLDEADPIPDSYVFEVGSPGIERELKCKAHFDRYIGSDVEVKLYKAIGGSKVYVGRLTSFSDGNVSIDSGSGELSFGRDNIAQVRLHVEF